MLLMPSLANSSKHPTWTPDRDLPAAIEREDERSGEVRAEVDLSGGNRLVRHPGIIGNDVVDLRDAFVREQFVDDISRGGAEARAPAERDFRRLGRGFLRQRRPALVAPNKSGRCRRRGSGKKKITPGGKHWRLPLREPAAFHADLVRRSQRRLPQRSIETTL